MEAISVANIHAQLALRKSIKRFQDGAIRFAIAPYLLAAVPRCSARLLIRSFRGRDQFHLNALFILDRR
jgi:hypothetical protein